MGPVTLRDEKHSRGVEGSSASCRPGRHRPVVEHTPARPERFRRPTIRHERRADIHRALTPLACFPIRLGQIVPTGP